MTQINTTRIFTAPIEMVWKLWTDPELVKLWWGPKDFAAPIARLDFREGGRSFVSMRAPEAMGGQEWYSVWEYVEIKPLQRIEFIQSLVDSAGNKTAPEKLGMPADFPPDVRTVVTFRSIDDNETEMSITEHANFGSISNFAKIGLEQMGEKMLAVYNRK